MINWKVRIRNKSFWVSLIPALIILIQAVASVFGIALNLGDIGDRILNVINAIFVVLSILGIVTDPTTPGVEDSDRAKSYVVPGESGEIERPEDEDRND